MKKSQNTRLTLRFFAYISPNYSKMIGGEGELTSDATFYICEICEL